MRKTAQEQQLAQSAKQIIKPWLKNTLIANAIFSGIGLGFGLLNERNRVKALAQQLKTIQQPQPFDEMYSKTAQLLKEADAKTFFQGLEQRWAKMPGIVRAFSPILPSIVLWNIASTPTTKLTQPVLNANKKLWQKATGALPEDVYTQYGL